MICSSVNRFFFCPFSCTKNIMRTHNPNGYRFQPQVKCIVAVLGAMGFGKKGVYFFLYLLASGRWKNCSALPLCHDFGPS